LRTVPLVLVLVLAGVAYVYGAWSHEHRWFPTPQLERVIRQNLWQLRGRRGFNDTTGRTEVPCSMFKQAGTAILLTLGQSNAANEGETRYVPRDGVYNFNFLDGKCYVARDPLLGTTGSGGSVWTRVGDRLIASGQFERVLIVPIAVGSSRIEEWAPGGQHHARIRDAQSALDRHGLHITHVLWHQGESDVQSTTHAEYVERFRRMLEDMRAAGVDAPVYVAVASICQNHGSEAIRQAQREIAATLSNVRPGPDTDTLDRFVWRFDLCHLSTAGLDEHARLWIEALREGSVPVDQ
jgi:carbohydrate esterase-like sialic acid-specific acetylesterase